MVIPVAPPRFSGRDTRGPVKPPSGVRKARARPGRRARTPPPDGRHGCPSTPVMSRYGGGVEPEPRRERETPSERPDWSPYDEAAALEDAEWRRSRRRRWWAIFGVAFLGLCLLGSAAGYILYDRATRIDRSDPELVVEHYVYAIFGDRDLDRAAVFECHDSSARKSVQALLSEIEERESRFNISITVSTANYSSSVVGDNAEVAVSLRIDVPEDDGKPSRSTQDWRFQLRDEDGWRVCGAAKQEP